MNKPNTKQPLATKKPAQRAPASGLKSDARRARQRDASKAIGVTRAETKGAKIISLLRAPVGASIQTMMAATGWQPHSVRGFLSGTVRKRLKLNLISEHGDSGRIYRIKASGRARKAGAEQASAH